MKFSSYLYHYFSLKVRGLTLLLAIFVVQVWFLLPAAGREKVLEDLQYRADIWVLTDAARARVTFTRLGQGRYRAEVAAKAQGLAKLLSGQRQDKYATEMVWRRGLLVPLVYREESRRWGKHHLKEYRFDYKKGRLELWQQKEGKGLVRKWETALKKEPIYDPLSAFYNFRLGALGQPRAGESVRLKGIPYPRPEDIVIQIGQREKQGRKVMVSLINRVFNDEGVVVFVIFDEKWVPSKGWSQILRFGKVAGQILPGSKPLHAPLAERHSGLESSRLRALRKSLFCHSEGSEAQ
ncbi:MAG: DUF3108 domain-containing protein [Syntrophales bacterium]|nr:DUF3108 domain-containing protein [Syntrophales bacterium]MDD5642232.1 DUF3108 domain-containing protein [Syntrophales bacterium]